MTDETFVDSFNDNDTADPQYLPQKKTIIGEIMDVAFDWRKFEKPIKDGRSAVPVISVNLRARKFGNGDSIDGNFLLNSQADFWVDKQDVIGRNSLARLIAGMVGESKEELTGKGIVDSAKRMIGGKVSYELELSEYTRKDGSKGMNVNVRKLKPATSDELALLM